MQIMNISNRLKLPLLARCLSKTISSQRKIFFENLSLQRSLLQISGNGVYEFLQGLTTNDIFHMKTNSAADNALFTMFLNKQGRVLFDTIIYKSKNEDSTVLIECDRRIENQLKQHLNSFRVRKKISIDTVDHEFNVWVGFVDSRCCNENLVESVTTTCNTSDGRLEERVLACFDPRLSKLGIRFITPSSFNIKNFKTITDNVECSLTDQHFNYTKHRYIHGISEGIIEIPTLRTFPFEANCDYLHGISFHKGCYLGQEFTARTYHTGIIRKRIMPLTIPESQSSNIYYNAPIFNENGLLIGNVRGIQNGFAIGSLKVDKALSSENLNIGDLTASTHRPIWWPKKNIN